MHDLEDTFVLQPCHSIADSLLRNKVSRRLRQAASRIDEKVASLRALARGFTPVDCEGDAELATVIQTQLRLIAELLSLRFNYIKLVLWNFCKADEPLGAAEFLRGATSRPSAEQDPRINLLFVWGRRGSVSSALSGAVGPESSKFVAASYGGT